MIPTLDLFSGIAGFSYALNSIAKTVAYCEINKDCRDLLSNLMNNKKIDEAPIFEDITKLTGLDLKKLKPKMLTAGFPCTDISGANINGKGLDGSRSGLFFEIMRIIDETPSISYILLENSPMIRIRGLSRIRKELKKRNFNLVWGYFEAKMVGALHKRKRWICFGYKELGTDLKYINEKSIKYNWTKTIPLIVKKTPENKNYLNRCMMLGNSIVPQMIRYAWNVLLQNTFDSNKNEVKDIKSIYTNNVSVILYDSKNTITKHRWATPTFSRWGQYKILTERGTHNLSNQIFYKEDLQVDSNIPINMRDKFYRINPNFIENLMGYPKDWTKF
jgi:DNA (cytosine-5)-methyltransferase 1